MNNDGGITIGKVKTMMNHNTTEIFLDDVRVPHANMIGKEGEPPRAPPPPQWAVGIANWRGPAGGGRPCARRAVIGSGFKVVLDAMNAERALIAAECIGDGRWFVEKVCSVPLAESERCACGCWHASLSDGGGVCGRRRRMRASARSSAGRSALTR